MQLKTEKKGSITVVISSGRIDAVAADDLQALLTTLLQEKNYYLLMDCCEMSYLSSAGMRVFLSTAKEVEKFQGKMLFSGFSPMIQEILKLAGIEKHFEHFETTEIALQAFTNPL